MLADVIAGARGTWPLACAWLLRLALESELTRFWQSACPPAAECRSHRALFLLLPWYVDPAAAHRAALAWAALSRAGHHHCYELGLTASELGYLRDEVRDIITILRTRLPPVGPGLRSSAVRPTRPIICCSGNCALTLTATPAATSHERDAGAWATPA
jgi:hypothetical protein